VETRPFDADPHPLPSGFNVVNPRTLASTFGVMPLRNPSSPSSVLEHVRPSMERDRPIHGCAMIRGAFAHTPM
jgi:hypothetical protein